MVLGRLPWNAFEQQHLAFQFPHCHSVASSAELQPLNYLELWGEEHWYAVASLLSRTVRNQPQMHSTGTRGVILRDNAECCFPWRLEGSEGQSNLPGEKITIAFIAPQLKRTQTNPNRNALHREFPLISRHPMHLKKKSIFWWMKK